ncbi:MAG TPA: 50S ribosomal protein L4 [Caldilineaceae bacterium]|nr:50S ribosomal protein L4 [Caldilineaceae bacterium]
MAGNQTGEIEVSDAVFGAPVNQALMHQALVRQLSNARLGTHKTKTRGEVSGGGRKPWRQKGTGRARQGSIRAPHWVGGGTVFGPTPRTYIKAMPKKMHRAALRSALSAKTGAGEVVVLELALSEAKTKHAAAAMKALGLAQQSVLLVVAEKDPTVERSFANLPKVKMLLSSYLNVRDLLGYDVLVFARDAVAQVESWLGADVAEKNGAQDGAAQETEPPAYAGAAGAATEE